MGYILQQIFEIHKAYPHIDVHPIFSWGNFPDAGSFREPHHENDQSEEDVAT